MKTRILTLLALIAIALVSCKKDEADKPVKTQDVSFGVELIDQNGLKTDYECQPGVIATYAHIELEDANDALLVFKPQIFFLNGKLYTQALNLPVGTYELVKFLLMAADESTVVMATPQIPSAYASYVTKALKDPQNPFLIVVPEFDKIEVKIDVLCFVLEDVDEFGFFWFLIDETIVREQCFFGDLCIKNKADYVGSYYDVLFNLELYPFDLPAIFKVKLVRNDGWQKEFMNIDIDDNGAVIVGSFKAPLCVKYPDRVDVDDEFTATLSILVAQGNGWEFVEFKTWQFTDFMFNELSPNQGVAINFVVGNCNYDPNPDPDYKWIFPAWINLPQTAQINIAHDFDWLYWHLDVQSVDPDATGFDLLNVGEWASFCGDGNKVLTSNPYPSAPYTFHIYNTLAYDWDENPMPYDDAEEKFEKIHWLINNLGSYGLPAPQGIYITSSDFDEDETKALQDAIWYIVRDGTTPNNGWASGGTSISTLSNTLQAAATTFGVGFKPLPGQWSSVLIIKDDQPKSNQLVFAMIDP